MPPRKRILNFQAADDDNAIIVPKESIQQEIPEVIQASSRQVNKLIKDKKPRSEAQLAATKKLIEASNAKREAARKEKEEQPEVVEQRLQAKREAARQVKEEAKKKALEEERDRKRQEQAAQLAAGTHVKIYIKEKKPRGRSAKKKVETETETDTITETETEVPTDTEDDTDIEEYKKKARVAHRAKKVVRTIQKIDQVLQQPVASNPYAAMLASRWR